MGNIRYLLGKAQTIKSHSEDLLRKIGKLDNAEFENITGFLINEKHERLRKIGEIQRGVEEEIKVVISSFNKTLESDELSDLGIKKITYKASPIDGRLNSNKRALLRELIIDCDEIISFLSPEILELSVEEMDKLDHIRKEILAVSDNLDINFEKNLEISLKQAEKGNFLGSTLITARVVEYILQKIDGKTIEDKIKFLISKNIIENDREDIRHAIIKASRKSRNFFTHRIDTFAGSSDALSILGDCIKLLEIYKKLSNLQN